MKTDKDNTGLPPILVRLQQFMDHEQLTAYQINKEAGLCKGLIQNAFSAQRGLTTSTLEALLNAFPQLNANWLIVGRGEMLCDEASAPASPSSTQQHIEHLDKLQAQCIEMIKAIQQMKLEEQQAADARILDQLLKG